MYIYIYMYIRIAFFIELRLRVSRSLRSLANKGYAISCTISNKELEFYAIVFTYQECYSFCVELASFSILPEYIPNCLNLNAA